MATFSFGSGSTNYTGEVLEDLLTYTAQENETYKNGLIHIKSGIQKKYTLPGISLGSIIQDHKATPASPSGNNVSTDSSGQYTFAERYLEPEDFMIYIEFNPRNFPTICLISSLKIGVSFLLLLSTITSFSALCDVLLTPMFSISAIKIILVYY